MAFPIAQGVLHVGMAYLVVGAGVGLAFLLFGLDRIDPAARDAYGFRALIFPGLALLWPLVILRWRRLADDPQPQGAQRPVASHAGAHLVVWLCLAGVIPLMLACAAAQRRAVLPEPLSIRLSAGAQP